MELHQIHTSARDTVSLSVSFLAIFLRLFFNLDGRCDLTHVVVLFMSVHGENPTLTQIRRGGAHLGRTNSKKQDPHLYIREIDNLVRKG